MFNGPTAKLLWRVSALCLASFIIQGQILVMWQNDWKDWAPFQNWEEGVWNQFWGGTGMLLLSRMVVCNCRCHMCRSVWLEESIFTHIFWHTQRKSFYESEVRKLACWWDTSEHTLILQQEMPATSTMQKRIFGEIYYNSKSCNKGLLSILTLASLTESYWLILFSVHSFYKQ